MMKQSKKDRTFGFTTPATYKIKVQGEINQNLSGYFCGMELSVKEKPGRKYVSYLIGNLRDQSALSGVLNALFNMRLAVISVIKMK